ncbi:MAG: type I restriction enzyme M protein [Brevundimonas sp.]|jgi:type I restriction enzyme M protein|uniref:N-6 DNA methylase n=1 Tax=Brevundimonas sp. TaxID=1871086 RepID=UPI0039E2B817
MSEYATVAEAASFLDVSKATLRNWDRNGKLKPARHPSNDYRLYALSDLRALKSQLSLFSDVSGVSEEASVFDMGLPIKGSLTAREVKRVVARLHNALRDTDAGSSLIERFDELSKMLFLGMSAARNPDVAGAISSVSGSPRQYADRMRSTYERLIAKMPFETPPGFEKLKLSDAGIAQCGEILAAVDFAHSDLDVKGLAYEEVIKRTFDKTENQQFFTPSAVVQFMVDFIDEVTGEICDPAAGTGGFLVEIARRNSPYSSLTALEIDPRLAWTAGLNTLLHGGRSVRAHCLEAGGSLGAEAVPFFKTFDLIVTNPPFGSDFSDARCLANYELGQGRATRRRGILFIERCWHLLKAGGRLAIVLDEGVLNLPHAEDVRRFIYDRFEIEAIVGLPETTFMPYATVNAVVLFLRKSAAPSPNQRVFFARADRVGRKSNGDDDIVYMPDGSSHLASDLPQIVSAWRGGAEPAGDERELYYWSSLERDALAAQGFRLDFRFHHPSREESAAKLETSKWPLMTISDLCNDINQSIIPAKELPDSVILYTGLAHIEANSGRAVQEPTPTNSLKSSVKRYEPGDIVFARMRPALRKVALMAFEEGGYVSPECSVLRPLRDDSGFIIDPELLATVLRSDLTFGQLTHLIAGIGRPRLSGKDIRRVRIPLPPHTVQASIRQSLEASQGTAQALRQQADQMIRESKKRQREAVAAVASELAGEQ